MATVKWIHGVDVLSCCKNTYIQQEREEVKDRGQRRAKIKKGEWGSVGVRKAVERDTDRKTAIKDK